MSAWHAFGDSAEGWLVRRPDGRFLARCLKCEYEYDYMPGEFFSMETHACFQGVKDWDKAVSTRLTEERRLELGAIPMTVENGKEVAA